MIIIEKELKPMSLNEFHNMIDKAIQDSDSGRVISHEELKNKVNEWKYENQITIASVFDCRQNPEKLKIDPLK